MASGDVAVGIDRLSFSFPVKRAARLSSWDRVSKSMRDGSETRQARVPIDSFRHIRQTGQTLDGNKQVTVMVGLATINGKPWGKVEANPARFGDPDGCSLLDPRLLGPAIAVMWNRALTVLEPECDVLDARVTRMDVSRDFRGITSPSLFISGLGPIQRPWARRSFTYNDPGRASAQTLYVGSGAGGCRLYDQHQAYADKGAPEGSLRWEIEARKDWLAKCDMGHIADLDPFRIRALARERWDWSAMGHAVTGPVAAVDVLRRAVAEKTISRAVANRLIGTYVMDALGGPGVSRATEYRYRALGKKLGVGAGALFGGDGVQRVAARLDFEAGTEVLTEVSDDEKAQVKAAAER